MQIVINERRECGLPAGMRRVTIRYTNDKFSHKLEHVTFSNGPKLERRLLFNI